MNETEDGAGLIHQTIPDMDGTEPRLTQAMIDRLRQYAEWCGGVHDDGCPEDDTCECSGRPINDAVNAICKLKIKPALKCHNGSPHYCPNCDRSFSEGS